MMLPLLALASAVLIGLVIRRGVSDGQGLARKIVLPVLAVAVVGMFVTGGIPVGNETDGGSSAVPYLVLVGVMLVALGLLVFGRPREAVEQRWTARTATVRNDLAVTTASATATSLASNAATTSTAVMNGAAAGPRIEHRPSSASGVARALGRAESRELAQSPFFGVGIGFCVLIFLLFVVVWGDDDSGAWAEWVQLLPWFVHPLVGMTVLASHRAVTRARRDDTTELFDTCPAEQSTRTIGFLLTAVVPMVTIAVFIAAMMLGTRWVNTYIHGPLGFAHLGDLLGNVVLGAGGVVLGVALGRWLRFGLVPVVAIVAVLFASSSLNGVGGKDWNPLRELSTVPTIEGASPVFGYRPVGWHLLWLLALTGVVMAIALARHRRDRFVGAIAAGSIVVATIAGVAVTRPMPASAAREIASLIAEPEAHQECVDIDDRVTVCTYSLHRSHLEWSRERLAPIAAALPADAPPITLRQVYDGQLADLPPEVRRLLTKEDLVRPAGEGPFHFEFVERPIDHGLDLALVAVGLPAEPASDLFPYIAASEARGVVALWLASRGLEAKDAARLTRAGREEPVTAFEAGSIEETGACSVPAVVWSAQDLVAARAVNGLPDTEVARVLDAEWARWIDPLTTTDELLAALGLPGVGAPYPIVPERGQPC